MVNYKSIIDELESLSLTMIPLHVLKSVSSSYQMALIQPSGNVEFEDDYVRNDAANNAVLKFTDFLSKASSNGNEIVLSPEYSCPWQALQSSLDSGAFPQEGAIWILGCESTSLVDLESFKSSNSSINFINESLSPRPGRNFVSPVCYLFNAKNMEGIIEKVIVIQFKTTHMYDPEFELEKDHLLYGTKRYWICNDNNSVQLSALICAESLHPEPIKFIESKSYLIAHLQLNTQPFHATFSQYRRNAFMKKLNIEIISLNWSKGFTLNGVHPSLYGGSAVYTKAEKVKLDDYRINTNHQKGVYYSFEKSMKYHVYNLNYEEHVFYLKNSNMLQSGHVALMESRTGIEAVDTLSWASSTWSEIEKCDDKWMSYLDGRVPIQMLPLNDSSAIAKERFLTLSGGFLHGSNEWASPKKLDSFNIDTDGRCNHFSVYDNLIDKNAIQQKINNAVILSQNFITTPVQAYPDKFNELYEDCKLIALEDKKFCQFNVSKKDDTFPATFIYAGRISNFEANEVFDRMAIALECSKRRLVVWYQDSIDGEYKRVCAEKIPTIDEDCSTSSIAIDKEDE